MARNQVRLEVPARSAPSAAGPGVTSLVMTHTEHRFPLTSPIDQDGRRGLVLSHLAGRA